MVSFYTCTATLSYFCCIVNYFEMSSDKTITPVAANSLLSCPALSCCCSCKKVANWVVPICYTYYLWKLALIKSTLTPKWGRFNCCYERPIQFNSDNFDSGNGRLPGSDPAETTFFAPVLKGFILDGLATNILLFRHIWPGAMKISRLAPYPLHCPSFESCSRAPVALMSLMRVCIF